MLGRGGKAATFLLTAGFLGGFSLSHGSTHILFGASHGVEKGGHDGGGAQSASSAQAGGGGGPRGGMAEGEGKQRARGGGAGGGEGGGGQQASAAEAGGGSDPPPAQAASAGADDGHLIDHLSGNSLAGSNKDGVSVVRYLSRQGWQAIQTQPNTLTVRRWVARASRLCEVTTASDVVCETLAFSPVSKPKDGIGAVLGTVTMAAGDRWTLLRGNPAGMPEVIPLIGGERPRRSEPLPKTAMLVGKPAIEAFMGRTLLAVGDRAGLVGTRYETDGRWIAASPLQPGDSTGLGGVRVSIGHWLYTAGMFCTDRSGLELSRACFRPEQWGPGTFRLVSQSTAAVTTLVGAAAGL